MVDFCITKVCKHMKYLVFIFITAMIAVSCSSSQQRPSMHAKASTTVTDTLRIANDSLEYEIMIIEPGFNGWLATQHPRSYYSEPFLENRNRQYVIEYNQRVLQPQRYNPNLYQQTINYESNIHYGLEVNYLLYHYFLFFEQRYNQRFFVSRRQRF